MSRRGPLGAALLAPGMTRAQPVLPVSPSQEQVTQHLAGMLAQCPQPPQRDDVKAAKLPIHVTPWGTTGPRALIIHGGVQGGARGGPARFASVDRHGGIQSRRSRQRPTCLHG